MAKQENRSAHVMADCPMCLGDMGDKPHGLCPSEFCLTDARIFYGESATCDRCDEELVAPVNRKITPSIRVENETRYDTSDLRTVLTRTQQAWLDDHEPKPDTIKKGVDVTIDPSTAQYGTGRLYLRNRHTRYGLRVTITYGRQRERGEIVEHRPDQNAAHGLSRRFAYGLFWLSGLDTSAIAWDDCRAIADRVDLPELHFESEEDGVEEDPLAEQKERYRHRLEKVSEWQTKRKRAQTYLDKWKRKVRYYRREYPEMAAAIDEEMGVDW